MFNYEIYGDSPTCLNDKFDISNKEAIIQGFGLTSDYENHGPRLKQNKVVTVSNENCTKCVQANAKELEAYGLPYGNGFTFSELPNGINREILCSRGIVQENGVISVSTYYYWHHVAILCKVILWLEEDPWIVKCKSFIF